MARPKSGRFAICFMVAALITAAPPARGLAQERSHQTADDARKKAEVELAGGGPHTAAQEVESPMKPEPSLAIWTLVVFIGVLLVLGKYAWKPLLAALHNREKHLEHVLLEAERARNESEANLAEHRKLMARAGDEVRTILDKARQEAQTAADGIVKHAQGEADAAKQRAQRDIASARDAALAEIWQKTADMAVSVAGRVLSKQLTDADRSRLLDAAIAELPASANGHGGGRP
jgi:F-type H+-transporting ATPase subunit b